MTISIANLPTKFHTRLLGHPNCPAQFKGFIEAICKHPLQPLKENYIFDAERWVLKLPRTDPTGLLDPNTHLYRVRKAQKIHTYITNQGLSNHFIVPEKYLYWKNDQKIFYTVSTKISCDALVAKPESPELEQAFKNAAPLIGGQAKALLEGSVQRELTTIQAKGLAELAFNCGYTDLTYNNLFFKDGKVVILDTEPVKRTFKKQLKQSIFFYLFGEMDSIKTQQALTGTAKLKLYSNSDAKKAIEKVEKTHVLWSLAKLITKLAIVCSIIYFTPTGVALLPLTGLISTMVKVIAIGILALKAVIIMLNTLSVVMMHRLSKQGLNGVNQIANMEMQAYI